MAFDYVESSGAGLGTNTPTFASVILAQLRERLVPGGGANVYLPAFSGLLTTDVSYREASNDRMLGIAVEMGSGDACDSPVASAKIRPRCHGLRGAELGLVSMGFSDLPCIPWSYAYRRAAQSCPRRLAFA